MTGKSSGYAAVDEAFQLASKQNDTLRKVVRKRARKAVQRASRRRPSKSPCLAGLGG